MSFISNLKITGKILLCLTMMALLCAGMTTFAIMKAGELNEGVRAIVNDPVAGVRLAGKVDGAFTRMHQLAFEIAVESDNAKIQGLHQEFQDQFGEVNSAVQAMKPLMTGENTAPYEALTTNLLAYARLETDLLALRTARDPAGMETVLQDRMTPVFDVIDQSVSTLVTQQNADIDTAVEEAESDYTAVFWWLIGSGVVGVVLIGGFATMLAQREIVRPIAGLTKVMQSLAGGNLDVDVAGQERKDEIGQMSGAVQVFKDNGRALKEAEAEKRLQDAAAAEAAREQARVVEAVGRGLSHLSDGDLTFELGEAFPSAYEKLRVDFNTAMRQLQDAMKVIVVNVDGMSSGAGEISQAADDLSVRTEQQAATLEETAAALDEITATVKRTAEGAGQANGVVTVARDDAEKSGEVVRRAVSAMNDIERSATEISQIIGVIDEIAFQTNLLALNAGVEAARAGEAGRGFAVVASEVRALAQRSAEAAKEIKALISTSSQQVKEGVDLVGRTGEALERIVGQVTEITGLVCEISASAQEQATALTQVNTAVNQMDQMTQQNAAMVEESTAASHSLAEEAHQLASLVSKFQIGSRAQPVAAPKASGPASAGRQSRPGANPVAAQRARVAAFASNQATAVKQDEWEEF